MGTAATPAAALDSGVAGAWSAAPGDGVCGIEFGEPDRTAFFGLARPSRSDYRIYGTFLESVNVIEGQVPEIYAQTDAESVLIAGPPEAFERNERSRTQPRTYRRTQYDPLAELAELAAGEERFSLKAPGLDADIALTGFAEAYENMQQCVAAHFESGAASGDPSAYPRPPILIAFDGIHQLGREASRQGGAFAKARIHFDRRCGG